MKPTTDHSPSERKWRNKKTGIIYASVEHNGTAIASVTTDAGSRYSVRWDNLEEVGSSPSGTGSEVTIKSLEKQAMNFWEIMLDSGLSDGHCKSYDPLTIEEDEHGYNFLSYIFDHEDGHRSRYFKSLEDGQKWLLHSFKDWLDDDRIEKGENY